MGKVGTFGDISFFCDMDKKGRYRSVGISNLRRSASASFEEHERPNKKSYLEFIKPSLETISFDVFVTAQLRVKPKDIQKKLHNYLEKGTPSYFVLGGEIIGSRWVITQLSDTYKTYSADGRPVAISFGVTLTEYTNPGGKKPKLTNTKKTNATKTKTTSSNSVKKTSYTKYVTQKGDTLWSIAKKFYKDGSKYTKIYNANKTKQKGFTQLKSPNDVSAGYILKIPK